MELWENVLGALTAEVSRNDYPPAKRGLRLSMSRSAIAIGYGSLGFLVDEFYPDLSRWLFHCHDNKPLSR